MDICLVHLVHKVRVLDHGRGGDDPQVFVVIDVERELVRHVRERQVVGRCREEQDLAAVASDVVVNGLVGLGGVVAEVV